MDFYHFYPKAVRPLTATLLVVLIILSSMLIFPLVWAANPPEPTYGTATVDGDPSEWSIPFDFFADMYRAGDSTIPLESKAYLRYDCGTETMYVLVLTESGVPAVTSSADAWAAINTISNKVYTGADDGGALPNFAWVGQGYDGNSSHAQGYEAAFSLAPANYTIIIHIEVYDASNNQTSATVGFPRAGVPLSIICTPNPAIQVLKMVSTDNTTWVDANAPPGPTIPAGTNIYYQFNITNTGNVTLSNIALTDSLYGISPILPLTLAPNASYLYYYGPVTAQIGVHTNTANATATVNGTQYSDTDDANYNGTTLPNPAVDIIKFVSSDNTTWNDANTPPGLMLPAGDNVYYKFMVTNIGNVVLSNLTWSDNTYSLPLPPTSLAPNASFTAFVGPITALSGQQTNTATVNSQYNNQNYSDTDDANYFGCEPSINLTKLISSDNATWVDANTPPGLSINAGQNVYYLFVLNNTGNVELTHLSLVDNVYSLNPVFPMALGVGEVFDYYYGPTAALIGQHNNTAFASGRCPSGLYYNDTDTANYFGATPSIQIIKQISTDNATWVDANSPPGITVANGTNLYYKLQVLNTGNVELTNLTLTDDTYPLSNLTLPSTLAPNEGFTTYYGPVIAQKDQHTNTATTTGTYNNQTYSAQDSANYFGTFPQIQVLKQISADNSTWIDADAPPGLNVTVGANVYYRFIVTTTGNVESFNITLTDNLYTLTATPPMFLAPNASYVYYFGPITAVSGQQTNTATATGEYNNTVYSAADNATYNGMQVSNPSIKVTKQISTNNSTWTDADTPPGISVSAGANIYYRFIINNTGNVELTNITLTDNTYNLSIPSLPPTLAPNASFVYYFGPMQAQSGQHRNTATATGQYNTTTYTNTNDANYNASPIKPCPSIRVIKWVSSDNITWVDANTAPGLKVTAGSSVYFRFDVINTGNVPLTNLTLKDSTYKLPNLNLPLSLAPNETFTYYLGPIAAQQCQQCNTATATGKYNGRLYTDTDKAYYYGTPQPKPCIDLTKYVSADNKNWCDANCAPGLIVPANSSVYVKFVVKNTGNVPFTSVEIIDYLYPVVKPHNGFEQFAPGKIWTVVVGPFPTGQLQYINNATVYGTTADNQTCSDNDVAYIYGSLCTYTSADYSGRGTAAKLLTYNFKSVFNNKLEIGHYTSSPGYGYKWTSVTNLQSFLKCMGTNGIIGSSKLNPTNLKFGGGTLAVQVVTLSINIAFSNYSVNCCPSGFGELYYIKTGDSLSGLTVVQILALANDVLAGRELPNGYNYNSLSTLITQLNGAFCGCSPSSWARTYLQANQIF